MGFPLMCIFMILIWPGCPADFNPGPAFSGNRPVPISACNHDCPVIAPRRRPGQ